MNTFRILILLLVAGPATAQTLSSGLAIGSNCPAFDPYHVSGPDKNTRACPMCKYGSRQGVMIWVNNPDWNTISAMATRMEAEIETRGLQKFRVFIMYMNPERKPLGEVMKESAEFSKRLNLRKVAFTCIPDPSDAETAKLFEINPAREVKNTVLIYKKRKVVSKIVNMEISNLDELMASCDKLFDKDSF